MDRKHPIKLVTIFAVLCLWFNPAAAIEKSKDALLERLNIAGFDYVYEFPYVASVRTGAPTVQFTGRGKHSEYINSHNMHAVDVTPVDQLSYIYQTKFGRTRVAYAYRVGDAMVCYLTGYANGHMGMTGSMTGTRFTKCMVVPHNIDEVVAKIKKVSDAEVVAALPETEVVE